MSTLCYNYSIIIMWERPGPTNGLLTEEPIFDDAKLLNCYQKRQSPLFDGVISSKLARHIIKILSLVLAWHQSHANVSDYGPITKYLILYNKRSTNWSALCKW